MEEEGEHFAREYRKDREEDKETPTVSVSRDDLEEMASWAQMGEGSLSNINDPEGAKKMFLAIHNKVNELLGKED